MNNEQFDRPLFRVVERLLLDQGSVFRDSNKRIRKPELIEFFQSAMALGGCENDEAIVHAFDLLRADEKREIATRVITPLQE